MRRRGVVAACLVALALAGPAAAQRDPTSTDRFLQRIDRLPAPRGANLIREFGIPEWNARVLAAAQRYWLEHGGRAGGITPGAVTYRTQLPSGFNFDRYDLYRITGPDRRSRWTARRVHLRRVEVTDAASRTFPLDAVWRAYQRHGRNAASPAFQQERARLLPNPEVVARAVLVRIETADERSCPALAALGERALALAAERPSGAASPVPDGQASHQLTVHGAGGEPVFVGPGASPAGLWGEALYRQVTPCWRLQSINNPNRR